MLKRLLPCLLPFLVQSAIAQDTPTDTSIVRAAYEHTAALYYHSIDKQSRLYTGIEYFGYMPSIEGIPYFQENSWQRGSIVYDHLHYDTVQMMFDLVKDRVVILHYNGFFRMALFSEKVKEFTVLGHHFVRIEKDSVMNISLTTGFYDALYDGHTKMLVRRTKFIEETVKETLERKFVPIDRYYLLKNGRYHIVRTKKGLLSLLKDHAREVKQHLRKKKLKMRQEKEALILEAARYYDSLNN